MSPSSSDVSVITVNWNGLEHLKQLLPSVLSLNPLELILVDNASQDDSIRYVRENFPTVRIIENDLNRGFCQPNNQGAQAAKGTHIALINNDMKASPGWLEKGLLHFSDSVRCVASRILDWEGEKIDFNGASFHYLGYALQLDEGRLVEEVRHQDRQLFPCGGAMIMDRDLFLELGGFDEDYFAIYEDVDLGWRIWLAGFEVAFAPKSFVYHRGHASFERQPSARTRYLMHRNALLTILKNYGDEVIKSIFPLALVLTIKRALLGSGVEKESFYLWEESRRQLAMGDQALQERLLDSLNQLVSLDDVLDSLPRTLEKRDCVQATRKRSDQEIWNLFKDPFRNIVDDPGYRASEQAYWQRLGLDQFLTTPDRRRDQDQALEHLHNQAKDLHREMTGLQWLASHAESTPPRQPSGLDLAHRLTRSLKQHGVLGTFRLLREKIDDGV